MALIPPIRRSADLRPRPIDLNLLPPEYRRRGFDRLVPIFALLILVGLIGGIALLQLRLRSDDELDRWNARLNRAQTNRAALLVTENQAQEIQGKIASLKQQLEVMQNDYLEVNNRRVSWSQVYNTIISNAPPDMGFSTIQQRNYQIVVQGTGSTDASITGYAQKLSGSPLFSAVQIQSINEAPPGSGVPPLGSGPPPAITPIPAPPPTATRLAVAPTSPPQVATQAPPPPPAPTATPPPPATPQPQVQAPTPTRPPSSSSGEYKVVDRVRTSFGGTVDRPSVIRGKILDETGRPVPGITVKLTGPDTSMEQQAASGTFEFRLEKKGTYAVTLQGVKSETAGDLQTEQQGFTGFHIWDITFRRSRGSAAVLTHGAGGVLLPVPPDQLVSNVESFVPAERKTDSAARPAPATFAFTVVIQVKPGAGQVPAQGTTENPTPSASATPGSAAPPASGTPAAPAQPTAYPSPGGR